VVAKLAGVDVELEPLDEVARGAYHLCEFTGHAIDEAKAVVERHADLAIGLADASIAVLSRRYSCLDLLTLDERHFRVIVGADDATFRILPQDL
jgi:predicted nucleic acid-binding protein